jgi:hypothetical protein
MKARFAIAAVLVLALFAPFSAPAQQKAKSGAVTLAFDEVLPRAFSGWVKQPGSQLVPFAQSADGPNANVLKEFGFNGVENGKYSLNGREIAVKALRFDDATGAYGAFTFYRAPDMAKEKFCDGGASAQSHVLFYCGNVVIDAQLDRITAMTPAEMRTLAEKLPRAGGSAAVPPNLPSFLPEAMRSGVRFAVGPLAFARSSTDFSADMIDFNRSPEVLTSHVTTTDGDASSMVIAYPTFKIATQEEQRLLALAGSQQHAADGKTNTFVVRRVGPLVAVLKGGITPAAANALLDQVHYDADISWTESTGLEKKNNVGNLLVNMVYLSLILGGFSLVFGFAFGGARIGWRHLFRRNQPGQGEEADIIRLNL